jgi:hypothetical protein
MIARTMTRWDNKDWPNWLHEAWNKNGHEYGALRIDPHSLQGHLMVNTPNGTVRVPWDGYIVQVSDGSLWVYEKGLFEAIYVKEEWR